MKVLKWLFNKAYNWKCKKCGTVISLEQKPDISRCPKGVFHEWDRLK